MAEKFFDVTYSIMLYGAVAIIALLAIAFVVIDPWKRLKMSEALAITIGMLLVFWVVDVILVLISAGIRLIV